MPRQSSTIAAWQNRHRPLACERKVGAGAQVLSVGYFFGPLTRQNLNTVDYLKVAAVLAPQFVAGCLLYLMLLKRPEVGLVELLSVGSVLGIVSSTIADQIFVNLQLPKIGWLVSILVIAVAFVIFQKKKTIAFATILWRAEFAKSILPIAAIAMMALGTEFFWLFPSGVLFVLASFVSMIKTHRFSNTAIRLLIASAVVSGALMIINRPDVWWFLEEGDFPYLQALSHSLAERGISDGFLVSGTAIKYHWFTYAWIGLVERASNAAVFLVLTKVAPSVVVFLITGLSWSFIERYSQNRLRTFMATLVIMNASSYPLWVYGTKITHLISPSHFFATAILFASVTLIFYITQNHIRQATSVVLMMTTATMLSKAAHGTILVSAICFATVAQSIFKSTGSKIKLNISMACIGSALLTHFLFFSGTEYESSLKLRLSDFYWQVQGDARALPDQIIDIIGIFVVISLICLPALLAIVSFSQTGLKKIETDNLFSIGSLVSGSVLSVSLLGVYGFNLYFVYAAISISTLIGFAIISNGSLPKLTNLNWAGLIVAGVGLCFVSFLIPNLNSGSRIAIVIRSMRTYAPQGLIVFAIIYILITSATRHQSSFKRLFKLVIVVSSMAVTFSVYNWYRIVPEKHDEWRRNGAAYFASPNLETTSSWLNQNSSTDDIFASNFGWPKLLDDEIKFFNEPCKSIHSKTQQIEKCRRSSNSLLLAYVHRRAWLQAPAYHNLFVSTEVSRRQNTTLGFAKAPTSSHLRQMLDDSVDWFVVDRSTTDLVSWEPFATIRYKNDSFFVLELNT